MWGLNLNSMASVLGDAMPASCASAHRGLTTAHLTDEGPDTQGLSILTEITLLVNAGAGRRACVLNRSIPSMI